MQLFLAAVCSPVSCSQLPYVCVVGYRYRTEDTSAIARPSWSVIGRSLLIAPPALALPFVIRAAVVEGVATATEVLTIGIVYTIIVGLLFYRQFNWQRLVPMLAETAALSGAILLIIGTATSMAWCITRSGFDDLARIMEALPGGAPTFMLVSIVAFRLTKYRLCSRRGCAFRLAACSKSKLTDNVKCR